MTTHPTNVRSEKGVALIIVLLLLAVMSALTTGLTLNGQTEIAMAQNELYYAGARGASEAGLNRAIELITLPDNNLINFIDTPVVPGIGNGPHVLNADYSYEFELVDDDDPSLYPTPLTPDQLLAMDGEDGLANSDQNNRIILRCIGIGPKGTRVTLGRILSQTVIADIPEDDTFYTDPAILVNGNLTLAGNAKVHGSEGNVHANGNIHGNGNSYEVHGDLTASGDFTGNAHANGLVADNQPAINVPAINANDFRELADYIMSNTGTVRHRVTGVACPALCGWSFDNGTKHWSKSGGMPSAFTYYVEGSVSLHGTGNSGMTKLSIIAEGNITLTGNGKFKPENASAIQFVTNGDFTLSGNVDADDAGVDMDGQILVREQFDIRGNSKFQGRVMVENRDSATNAWHAINNPNGRRGSSTLSANEIAGNMKVTYNGGLEDVETTIPGVPGDPTYTNNISGWIEQ